MPIGGDWKTLVRLHTGTDLTAAPIYLPEDPAIPAKEIPARASFEEGQRFLGEGLPQQHLVRRVAAEQLFQRFARGEPALQGGKLLGGHGQHHPPEQLSGALLQAFGC